MKSTLKNVVVGGLGLLAAIYLVNPTAGVLELIPDNLPVIGNLDEATATTLLLATLAHFGWDLRGLLQQCGLGPRPNSRSSSPSDSPPAPQTNSAPPHVSQAPRS